MLSPIKIIVRGIYIRNRQINKNKRSERTKITTATFNMHANGTSTELYQI